MLPDPEEDAFQTVLDDPARRFDWTTYLVFADWLEERGDPRAEGYRAMGTCGRSPHQTPLHLRSTGASSNWARWFAIISFDNGDDPRSDMPPQWFVAMCRAHPDRRIYDEPEQNDRIVYPSARAARDAAALAFGTLDPEVRAQILADPRVNQRCDPDRPWRVLSSVAAPPQEPR